MPKRKRAADEGCCLRQHNTERAPIHAAHHDPVPKRKRAASGRFCLRPFSDSNSCAPLAPLTTKNIELLQQSLSGSRAAMRTPSPRRNTDSLDDGKKLEQYGIHVDTVRALPQVLQQSEDTKQSRSPAAVPSPNDKNMFDRCSLAAQQNKSTRMDDRAEAISFITRQAELSLNLGG
ncbi:hypothetical protein ACEQ8H_004443 [Pleosporales sp. CAS-2024a]